jgi:hypothetical protein
MKKRTLISFMDSIVTQIEKQLVEFELLLASEQQAAASDKIEDLIASCITARELLK